MKQAICVGKVVEIKKPRGLGARGFSTKNGIFYLLITIELVFNARPIIVSQLLSLRINNARATALLPLALTSCLSAVVFNVVMLHLGFALLLYAEYYADFLHN